ncbi:early nodulin-93-like [Panicum miliaceum]|uniref:Early nodulin-93-like n=1 Tax=Panicum miliaceum TaxID=4540 RepID=A0A3L6PBS9_PANMI|nr:early nodulin-93-like [Panicum miliaceum]
MSTVTRASLDQRLAMAKRCSREATLAGAKAAAVAAVASAVPTLASVPWAKANLNPTGQALIVCTAAGMAYFVAADKKILSLARRHSFEGAPEHLRNTSYQGAARPPAPGLLQALIVVVRSNFEQPRGRYCCALDAQAQCSQGNCNSAWVTVMQLPCIIDATSK